MSHRSLSKVTFLVLCALIGVGIQASAQTWLQPLQCSSESKLKLQNTNTPTSIQFVNDTSQVLELFSLDASGNRVLVNEALTPGNSFTADAFVTQPWVVTDSEGSCFGGVFLPVAAGGFAILKDSSSTTNTFVYVTSQAGEELGSSVVTVYDQASNIQVATVTGFQSAIGIAMAPGSGTVYVTDIAGNLLDFVDPITNTITASIPVGNSPFGVAASPDGKTVWVGNDAANTVSVIDTAKRAVIATIPVGTADFNPFWVAITPDSQHAYVSAFTATGGAIVEINVATHAIEATLTGDDNAGGLAITPDGRYLFATSFLQVGDCGNCGVAKIDTSTNEVVDNFLVALAPRRVSISPDGATGYVASGFSNGSVTAFDVANPSGEFLFSTPLGEGSAPRGMGLTPDGAFLYAPDLFSQVFEISTAEGTVVNTLPSAQFPSNVALATTSSGITQPLSPTALNVFNFGTNTYKVQYPPNTTFSGVTMTVVANEIPQAIFHDTRLIGTPFSNAQCIVYGGTGGNCVVYSVSCSPSPCPSSPDAQPDITIYTSYDTTQQIVNPGFLKAPDGTNNWSNVFTDFFQQRIDPTTKGNSTGFSDWVAVDLGVDPSTQAGTMSAFLSPLAPKNARVFTSGTTIPVKFQLKNSLGQFITNAKAHLSVQLGNTPITVKPANLKGIVSNTFVYNTVSNTYQFYLSTVGYAPGKYNLTVYTNSAPAAFTTFTIQ